MPYTLTENEERTVNNVLVKLIDEMLFDGLTDTYSIPGTDIEFTYKEFQRMYAIMEKTNPNT